MKDRYFFITVDTEADNQWNFDAGITTENTRYLPRFQELCEKYGFIPVWLTDYEMACDEEFVNYFKPKQDAGLCEIGMHLHAWTTPPGYMLEQVERERPFIYEYPPTVIESKVVEITKALKEKFGVQPATHRAGRWAFNEEYARILKANGYLVDCSVTPGIDWQKTKGQTGKSGPDFRKEPHCCYHYHDAGLLEVPVSIYNLKFFNTENITLKHGLRHFLGSIKVELASLVKGKTAWLRPSKNLSFTELKRVVDKNFKNNEDYLMFMIHSSELMAGGSPNFVTKESIERLYFILEKLFNYIKSLGYEGKSLRDFQKEVSL